MTLKFENEHTTVSAIHKSLKETIQYQLLKKITKEPNHQKRPCELSQISFHLRGLCFVTSLPAEKVIS